MTELRYLSPTVTEAPACATTASRSRSATSSTTAASATASCESSSRRQAGFGRAWAELGSDARSSVAVRSDKVVFDPLGDKLRGPLWLGRHAPPADLPLKLDDVARLGPCKGVGLVVVVHADRGPFEAAFVHHVVDAGRHLQTNATGRRLRYQRAVGSREAGSAGCNGVMAVVDVPGTHLVRWVSQANGGG